MKFPWLLLRKEKEKKKKFFLLVSGISEHNWTFFWVSVFTWGTLLLNSGPHCICPKASSNLSFLIWILSLGQYLPQDKHAINKSLHSNKWCFVKWKVTHFASFRFPVLLLFCCLCRYFIMQSCWAFDSRKRPSFPNLTSFLGCQLADAEAAVGSSTVFHKTFLGRKELHHSELSCLIR